MEATTQKSTKPSAESADAKIKQQSNLGFILKMSGKHKFKIIASCTLSVLSALLNLSPYFLMQAILASLIDSTVDSSSLASLVIWTSGLIVASVVLNFFAFAFSHITAFAILH